MDVLAACNGVLEVRPVFVGVQVVFGYGYLSATRHSHGDFVALDGYYVENNGMFAIEKLKFFEIKFVNASTNASKIKRCRADKYLHSTLRIFNLKVLRGNLPPFTSGRNYAAIGLTQQSDQSYV